MRGNQDECDAKWRKKTIKNVSWIPSWTNGGIKLLAIAYLFLDVCRLIMFESYPMSCAREGWRIDEENAWFICFFYYRFIIYQLQGIKSGFLFVIIANILCSNFCGCRIVAEILDQKLPRWIEDLDWSQDEVDFDVFLLKLCIRKI